MKNLNFLTDLRNSDQVITRLRPGNNQVKTTLRFIALLTLILTIGVGQMKAEVITLTQNSLGTDGGYHDGAEQDATISTVDFKYVNLMTGTGGNAGKIQVKASTGEWWNTSIVPGKITNVSATHSGTARNGVLYWGTSAKTTSNSATANGSFNCNSPTGCFGYVHYKRSNSSVGYWSSVVITYTPATITPSPTSITGLNYNLNNGPSDAQTFTVSGSNIPANLVVTAPTNFEVSLNGSSWASSQTISVTTSGSSGGTLGNTTVYVRLASGKSAGNYSGNVSIKIDGANDKTGTTPKTVAVSGTVSAGSVAVTGVTVDPPSKSIVPGETFDITPTISPSNATDKVVSWTSGSTTYATVSNGTVTGVAAGSSTITCTTHDGGYTATCAVTVRAVTMQARDEDGNAIAGGGPGAPTRSGASIAPAADAGNYVFKEWQITNASLGSSVSTKSNTITNPTGAVTVTAVYYKPIRITYKANNQVFTTQTYGYGGTLAFPASDPDGATYSCTGKTFVGWVGEANKDYSHASIAPTYATAGGSVTAAATYYAVFATSAGELSNSYAAITSGLETANYVIAYSYTGGTQIVLKNAADNSSPSDKLEGYNLSLTASKYSNPGASYIWELQAQPDGSYYIYNADAKKYVNATIAALTLSTTPTKFTISYDGTNSRWTIQIKDNSTYYVHGYVNSSAYDFRVSTSGSGSKYRIYLYKQESNITYSAYATTCSTEPRLNVTPTSLDFGNVANGTYKEMTFSLSGTNLAENASIAVSGTNSSYFTVSPSSVNKGSGTISATDITVRYTPGAVGDGHTATVTVTSGEAEPKTVTLTGNGKASYTVTCSPASNGSVLADKTSNVMSGETVTLTISPSSGYQLSSISAVDGSSNPVSLSGTGNTRTFTMPASNVTVTSAFVVRTDYVLVESALDDYSGEYLIVYHSTFDNFYALSGRQGNQNTDTYGTTTDVTTYYDADAKAIASNATTDAMKMIIEPGQTANTYTIYFENDNSYLGMTPGNTATGNKLRFVTSANLASNSYEWTISLPTGKTYHYISMLNNAVSPTRYYLNYNTDNSKFGLYTNQSDPELYKKAENCTKLAAPTGLAEADVTQTTATLSWNAVDNASGYEVSLDGGSNWTSTGTNRTYSVTEGAGWTQGTSHTWKVRATGDGSTYCDKGSQASHTVTMKAAVTVTYNSNGSTGGQLPVAGGVVNLTEGDSHTILGNTGSGGSPTPLTKSGYTFAGWHSSSTYSATPAYTIGGSITVNSSIIIYANWAPKRDTYKDAVHGNADQYGDGKYTVPAALSDATRHTSGTCEETHYKFIGWCKEGQDPTNPANIVAPGTTNKPATGVNYYAVWGEEL